MGTTEPWIDGKFDDAHYGLLTHANFPYPYHFGNQFVKNLAEGTLNAERMIQTGICGRMTDLVGGHDKRFGFTSHMADECRDIHFKEIAQKFIEVFSDGPTYLSFDLDALVAIYNSASSEVVHFGLDANWCWEVIRHVRASGEYNLMGAGVVEYAPQNDRAKE